MDQYDDYSFCKHYLIPGETILWKGKPGKGHLIGKDNILHVLTSLFAVVFISIWCYFVSHDENTRFMLYAGLFALGIAACNLFVYPVHKIYQRRNTLYILTNRKLIRKTGKKVDMLELRDLPRTYTYFRSDGSGSISFGHQTESIYYGNHRTVKSSVGLFRLDNIPDAARIYRMIMELNAASTSKET